MKKLQIILCVLLLALALTGCAAAAPEPAPEPTPEATPESTPDNTAAVAAALEEIGALIDDGGYYEAFRALVALEAEYEGDENARSACEAEVERLDALLKEREPESGTEFARSFAVQGGGVLEIEAFSGPTLVTVTDEYAVLDGNPNPPAVALYVRQGETGRTNLPAGTYRVAYQVGYRWFGADVGFGEYCTAGELEEPLVIDFYMQGQWASSSKFKITL